MMKIVDESILFFSKISLKILSGNSLQYVGIRGVYTDVCLECEKLVFPKQSGLVTWPHDLTELQL